MNTELVFRSEDGQAVTNSITVARKFGKEHRHVLESIRKLMTAENSAVLRMFEESWITSDELLERFQMFTRDWLRRYGWKLPRERVQIEINNTTKSTRWAYPQHKIERMIADGSMRLL